MKIADPTLRALYRLKAKLGREAARYERLYGSYSSKGNGGCLEAGRAYGEAAATRLAQGFVGAEIRRAKEQV